MKKTLFMGALALTIATSMVAGTMAVYTHADTLAGATNDTVSAKKFYINSTATDKINIKLAPGNEEFWDFQVTNHKEHIVTEVPMGLKLKVDLKNAAALPDLVCTLYRVDGDKDVALASGTRADGSTTIELEKLGEFAPNVEKDSTYKLGFYWKDTAGSNDALDTAIGSDGAIKDDGQANPGDTLSGISVTVTGTQTTDAAILQSMNQPEYKPANK